MTTKTSMRAVGCAAFALSLAGCGGAVDPDPSLGQASDSLAASKFRAWQSTGAPSPAGQGPGALFGVAVEFPFPNLDANRINYYTIGKDLHVYSRTVSGILTPTWVSIDPSHNIVGRPAVEQYVVNDPTALFSEHHMILGIGFPDRGLWTNTNFNTIQESLAGWTRIGTDTFALPFISDALVSRDDIAPGIALVGSRMIVCAMKTDNRIYCAENSDNSHGFPAAGWSAFQIVGNDGLPTGVTVKMGVALSSGDAGLKLAMMGSDGDYYIVSSGGTSPITWLTWRKLNLGRFDSAPSLTDHILIDIYGLAALNQIWESTIPIDGTPPGIQQITAAGSPSTGFNSGMGAALERINSTIRIETAAIGGDQVVYTNAWTGNSAEAILTFEESTLWTSPQTTPLSSFDIKTQGEFGLSVPGGGYRMVNSHALVTPLSPLTSTLAVDFYLPGGQPNPFWFGAVQMYATCASAGLNNVYLGQVELTGKPLNAFSRLNYAVPSAVRTALGQTRSDCFFSIAVNTNQTPVAPVLDNLRFVP